MGGTPSTTAPEASGSAGSSDGEIWMRALPSRPPLATSEAVTFAENDLAIVQAEPHGHARRLPRRRLVKRHLDDLADTDAPVVDRGLRLDRHGAGKTHHELEGRLGARDQGEAQHRCT